MIINGNLKFAQLGSGELQNAVMENMTTVTRDAVGSPADGQLIFNTTTNSYNYYNSSAWVEFATGGNAAALQIEVDAIETASGGIFDTDGTYDGTAVDAALGNVAASTSLLNTLTQLDTAITAAAGVDTLAELTDVTLTAPAANELLQYNGTIWQNVAATTIGEFGFKNITVDNGSPVVADQLGDTLGLITNTNGGVRTSSNPGSDQIQFSMAPGALTVYAPTIGGTETLVVNGPSDDATSSGKKMTVDKMLQDMDIPHDISSSGLIVRTADDAYNSRSIAASATSTDIGLTVANGDAIAGNPTVGLDISLMAADTGAIDVSSKFVFKDGTTNANKYLTLTNLTSNIISVGIALDDLSDVVITSSDTNDMMYYNGTNWVDGTPAEIRTAIGVYSTTQADTNFVDVAGDTMTGVLNMGSQLISSLATPVSDTDASTKGYVDSKVAGLTWKNSVRAASVVNIALTGAITVDSTIVTVTDDRILVRAQTDASENGIYIVDTTAAWTRAEDFDEVSPIDEINSAAVFVEQGNTLADTGWTVTSNVVTLDTDDIIFTQFNGASGITAGAGLVKTGNTLDVVFGAGLVELPADGVGIDLYADEALHLTIDGTTDSTAAGSKLQLRMDGSTLTSAHNGLKVSAAGISETELNASVAGDGIQGGAGTALSLDLVASSGLEITGGELDLVDVPNSALDNSALSIAADSGTTEVADLGETITIAGGTGIDTVVSATNTVTASLNASINLLSDVDTATASPSDGDALVWNNTNSEWVPGNPVNSSSELSDVAAAATVAGQVLVSDGTNYTPRQIQFVDTQASATSWTVTHNLNQKFVNVTVYDNTDNMIIPQTVVATSNNVTTITFNTAVAGTAVVMGINGLVAV